MKDRFSKQAGLYARFRPGYPAELFDFLLTLVPGRESAWDCGTGNGQLALQLAQHFRRVVATDISDAQIGYAPRKTNVAYSVQQAEQTSFPDSEFDLITAAQAVHWFEFEPFYREVRRTLKPRGIIALIGYSLPRIDATTDKVMDGFYSGVVGPYWDRERRYVDERYRTILFPFREIIAPSFSASHVWELDELVGFIDSWSAVQRFKDSHGENPIDRILPALRSCWRSDERKTVTFPIFMRVGTKEQDIDIRGSVS